MKVYLTKYRDPQAGLCRHWFATRKAAEDRLKELQAQGGLAVGTESTQAVEFPVRKPAVLSWLNENCSHNNG